MKKGRNIRFIMSIPVIRNEKTGWSWMSSRGGRWGWQGGRVGRYIPGSEDIEFFPIPELPKMRLVSAVAWVEGFEEGLKGIPY